MEAAAGLTAPDNARIIRNLILGADFLHSHILHFYHLALLELHQGPGHAALDAGLRGGPALQRRRQPALVDHYVQALTARRQAHEMGAIFGGRLPAHRRLRVRRRDHRAQCGHDHPLPRPISDQIIAFIDNVYLPDVDLLAGVYPDYYNIGRGYGNLLAFGVFDLNATGSSKLLAGGGS